jgi:hypothetical protein
MTEQKTRTPRLRVDRRAHNARYEVNPDNTWDQAWRDGKNESGGCGDEAVNDEQNAQSHMVRGDAVEIAHFKAPTSSLPSPTQYH